MLRHRHPGRIPGPLQELRRIVAGEPLTNGIQPVRPFLDGVVLLQDASNLPHQRMGRRRHEQQRDRRMLEANPLEHRQRLPSPPPLCIQHQDLLLDPNVTQQPLAKLVVGLEVQVVGITNGPLHQRIEPLMVFRQEVGEWSHGRGRYHTH